MLFALLIPLVPLGIALIVLVVKFSGLSHKALLKDKAHAIAQLDLDYPDVQPGDEIYLTLSTNAAFIKLQNQQGFALVEAIGDRFITRIIGPDDFKSSQKSGKNIEIWYRDFTHPHATYEFSSTSHAENLYGWLNNFKTFDGAPK